MRNMFDDHLGDLREELDRVLDNTPQGRGSMAWPAGIRHDGMGSQDTTWQDGHDGYHMVSLVFHEKKWCIDSV